MYLRTAVVGMATEQVDLPGTGYCTPVTRAVYGSKIAVGATCRTLARLGTGPGTCLITKFKFSFFLLTRVKVRK
eukprot:SAG11_NODE_3668_length_2298_cov_2.567076_1_plen_74_part_00